MAVASFFASFAHAASSSLKIPGGGQVLIDAKYANRDYDKGTLELSGNVKIIYNQQYMSCDRALINEKTHIVEAVGNLVISSPQAYVEGESAVMNYQDNTGIIQKGFVKSGQVVLDGSVIRKSGPLTYEAEDASYTACTTCPSAWTFNGKKMTAEMGSYAYIKYPWLQIAGFRVFWLPYLVLPLKSKRQSGFLIPGLDYNGTDGFQLGLKYFWAISRSQDATVQLKTYTRRGEKAMVNYRYMLNDKSSGNLNAAFLHDQMFATETSDPIGSKVNRWFLGYDQTFELPGEITQKTKLNMSSDLWYSKDFPLEMSGRGDPALENKASLTKNTYGLHSSIEADYYIDMLKTSPIASNDDQVQKWPEIRFSAVDRPLFGTNLLFRFNSDYTNFSRGGLGYDNVIQQQTANGPAPVSVNGQTPNYVGYFPGYPKQIDTKRNGTAHFYPCPPQGGPCETPVVTGPAPAYQPYYPGSFNPATDIVRTGQRLDMAPELAYPFYIGSYFDVLPTVAYHFTQYAFNVSSPTSLPDGLPADSYDTTPYRAYPLAKTSIRTRFYRIYGDDSEPGDTEPLKPKVGGWVDSESRSDVALPPPKILDRPAVYRHEFIPELVATYLPYVTTPAGHPFFNQGGSIPIFLQDQPIGNANFYPAPATNPNDPGQTPGFNTQVRSGQSIQFDYYDRLTTETALTAVLNNRLVRKRWKNGISEYKQIANWRLAESYDFQEAAREMAPKLPFADVQSALDLHFDQLDFASLVRYFPYHNVTDQNLSLRLKNEAGTNYVEIDYIEYYNITRYVEQTVKNPDSIFTGVGFTTKYVDVVAGINFTQRDNSSADFPPQAFATDFRIRPPGNCAALKLHIEQPFGVGPNFGLEFEYNFGGAPAAAPASPTPAAAVASATTPGHSVARIDSNNSNLE